MNQPVRIVGVHPVVAEKPVHLIEIEVAQFAMPFDFGEMTQELLDRSRSNWQVAYDERVVESKPAGSHYGFFFHYLDPKRPLLTAIGPLLLAPESPVPAHLSEIKDESP